MTWSGDRLVGIQTLRLSSLPEGQLPWPLFVIDFEASGLGEFTYPIEIGITSWKAKNAHIETWSSLIRPPTTWREHRIWNPEAEAIHGIRREQLDVGITPLEAMTKANATIGTHVAFCDGGEHDLRWLLHLAQAAGIRPSFQLSDWGAIGRTLTPEQYLRMIQWLEGEPVVHRAGADSERLMRAVANGLAGPAPNARSD